MAISAYLGANQRFVSSLGNIDSFLMKTWKKTHTQKQDTVAKIA